MNYNPKDDGVTHVNVYSKGNTELGRLLSNFSVTPFRIPFMGTFQSVEGYWYWICTGENRFKNYSGFVAKQEGKDTYHVRSHPTERELLIAYKSKLRYNPEIKQLLISNTLPLAHYYVYEGKVVTPEQWLWTALLWNKLE